MSWNYRIPDGEPPKPGKYAVKGERNYQRETNVAHWDGKRWFAPRGLLVLAWKIITGEKNGQKR